MAPAGDSPRKLIVFTIATLAVAIVIIWAAYLARDVLLLIYVSSLFAIGFSPLVRLIEKQKLLPIGSRRFPRWLAILSIMGRQVGMSAVTVLVALMIGGSLLGIVGAILAIPTAAILLVLGEQLLTTQRPGA